MKFVAAVLVVITILVPTFYLTAQDEGSKTLQEEMSALNVTMKVIASLLKKQVEGQETDLLIKRVELTNRTLLAKRGELAKAKADVLDLTEEERGRRLNLEPLQESLVRGNVAEEDRETLQQQMEQMEVYLKSTQTRREDLERWIVELENSVAAHEEDMEILEDVLDEKLGLL